MTSVNRGNLKKCEVLKKSKMAKVLSSAREVRNGVMNHHKIETTGILRLSVGL